MQQSVRRERVVSARVELHDAAHLNGGICSHVQRDAPSASVAGATTTDRWRRSNTSLTARAAQVHKEAHRKLSEQAPGFERDERIAGARTAASRVREEVCRHVTLQSPCAVILLATAAPRGSCGADSIAGP